MTPQSLCGHRFTDHHFPEKSRLQWSTSVIVRKSPVSNFPRTSHEVSLEGPAKGHVLAADDARLLYPRKHETLGEAALGYARDVSDPEQ